MTGRLALSCGAAETQHPAGRLSAADRQQEKEVEEEGGEVEKEEERGGAITASEFMQPLLSY